MAIFIFCTYTYTYIYIYVYIERGRQMQTGRERLIYLGSILLIEMNDRTLSYFSNTQH